MALDDDFPALPAHPVEVLPGCSEIDVEDAGKAGSPTPTQRRAFIIERLRQGPLPPGWQAKMARLWGISTPVMCKDVALAQEELSALRSPEQVQAHAHEQVLKVLGSADEIDAASRELSPEARIKALALSAGLRIKAAAELRNLSRKGTSLGDTLANALAPLSAASLKGST